LKNRLFVDHEQSHSYQQGAAKVFGVSRQKVESFAPFLSPALLIDIAVSIIYKQSLAATSPNSMREGRRRKKEFMSHRMLFLF